MTSTSQHSGRPVRWAALIPFGLAAFAAAALGGLAVSGETSEYRTLEQPSWAPPSEVFGPVWTVLYVMIALAGWLAWSRTGWGVALWVYAGQLVLNAVWSPLFFGAGLYGIAFLDIVLLWVLVGVTTVLFFRISRAAGLLLVPYWAWVTFAGALNLAIWQMN